MSHGDRARYLLVTAFGLGRARFAPGTFGTLAGVVPGVLLALWIDDRTWLAGALLGLVLVLWFLGCAQTEFVERTFDRKDPGAFVLDEVVGYLVTLVLLIALVRHPQPVDHVIAFLLFRICDVAKLPPVRQLERLPGAVGIMADDVAAGVQAGLVGAGLLWLSV